MIVKDGNRRVVDLGPTLDLGVYTTPAAGPCAEEARNMPASIPAAPLPCEDCLHSVVCGLREALKGIAGPEVVEHAPGLRLVITRTVECDHHLAAAPVAAPPVEVVSLGPAPTIADVERVQASRVRGGAIRGRQMQKVSDDQVIDALRESGGDAEAAGRLAGVTGSAIRLRVKAMRTRGTLPADVEQLVAARSRKAAA